MGDAGCPDAVGRVSCLYWRVFLVIIDVTLLFSGAWGESGWVVWRVGKTELRGVFERFRCNLEAMDRLCTFPRNRLQNSRKKLAGTSWERPWVRAQPVVEERPRIRRSPYTSCSAFFCGRAATIAGQATMATKARATRISCIGDSFK